MRLTVRDVPNAGNAKDGMATDICERALKEDCFFLYALVFAFCGLASKSSKYNQGHSSLFRSLTLLHLLLVKNRT